jgi:fructokinase
MEQLVMESGVDAAAAQIAARLEGRMPRGRRLRLAVAGPPGSGKSTVAEALVRRLNAGRAEGPAALVPMDGFHLDNRLLEARGLLARKGAPETFDGAGFAHMVRRLGTEDEVVIPVFDRSREIAIAGAAVVGPAAGVAVIEGNYLLLDEAPWRDLAGEWDLSVFLEVDEAELERRLMARWLGHGYSEEAARAKVDGNDLPNARRVLARRLPCDLVLQTRLKEKRES